ncbi:DUF1878 family protein [Lentibacillus sp. L22]|uniref:DUF1878 family protein n=1 Tax=Lentibacillus TaxID=175304 RepID=UPI0022B17CCD|nr:DUF1878 family protein [Lentibacillus daqui]
MDKLQNDDTIYFHLQLLAKLIDMKQYPFSKLIIDHRVTFQEYKDLLDLLANLNEQYGIQKEEGLLNFTALLVHFAGMLTVKLDPTETIFALKKEGYYPSLMDEFIKILEDDRT